jgi:hypothetical protein
MGGRACRSGIGFECRANFCDGGSAYRYPKTDRKDRRNTAGRIILGWSSCSLVFPEIGHDVDVVSTKQSTFIIVDLDKIAMLRFAQGLWL